MKKIKITKKRAIISIFSFFSFFAIALGFIVDLKEATSWLPKIQPFNQGYCTKLIGEYCNANSIIVTLTIISIIFVLSTLFLLKNIKNRKIEILNTEKKYIKSLTDYKTLYNSIPERSRKTSKDITLNISKEILFLSKELNKSISEIDQIEQKYKKDISNISAKDDTTNITREIKKLTDNISEKIEDSLFNFAKTTANSLKKIIENNLKPLHHTELNTRVILKFTGTPDERRSDKNNWIETPKETDISSLMITKSIVDNELYEKIKLERKNVKSSGHFVKDSTALLEAALTEGMIFCSNNTSAKGRHYISGPPILETGCKAKICIPVYQRIESDENPYTKEKQTIIHAFIIAMIKNEDHLNIFNEEHPESDPIVRFMRSTARRENRGIPWI